MSKLEKRSRTYGTLNGKSVRKMARERNRKLTKIMARKTATLRLRKRRGMKMTVVLPQKRMRAILELGL